MTFNPTFSKPYDPSLTNNFFFIQPREAPVFEPTRAEFQNPIAYIEKIRPIAEKAGICKIKPPPDWQPPFAVDTDKFKFVPRVQRLNELEAKTRVKLNFLDQIAKYWRLQGLPLKIPVVEKKVLDLYELHKAVESHGGWEKLDRDRAWHVISIKMGFDPNKSLPQILRMHYMKILHPYDVFYQLKLKNGQTENESDDNMDEKKDIEILPISEDSSKKRPIEVVDLCDEEEEEMKAKQQIENNNGADVKVKEEGDMEGTAYTPHGIVSRQALKPPQTKYARRSANCFMKTENAKEEDEDKMNEENKIPANKELARLAFFGAGPKLPGYDPTNKSGETKTRGRKVNYNFDPLEKYSCKTCTRGDKEEHILICDGCDDAYHTHCLVPPLLQVPDGDWRCPQCLALEVGKPGEAFGFEQATREYTLQQFGAVADKFKQSYFHMPVNEVPFAEVEREFWRIVSCIDADVTVQYGADLHTMDHGSGFPTCIAADDEMMALEMEYSTSPWNLNNLPVCDGSVLQYIDSDISGMKVPWMYVGMCFATFCWHNEDHWNYSINFLHWGEPKTWYGVPGSEASLLEDAMKSVAPELFKGQPDLLQQLVTIMNPNLLMERNVSVVRTDQQAGEFVVTFPRAYHAGFNQGYNFAEAVNFAPAEWIRLGRECVEHYSSLRRFCVFSHDELVLRMGERPERLNQHVAKATYDDIIIMVRNERKRRRELQDWGVSQVEVYRFEELADDERVCEECKTTCYLSGVSCQCQNGGPKHTCLKHYAQLCACAPQKHILRIRYSLDQLLEIIKRLKIRTERP